MFFEILESRNLFSDTAVPGIVIIRLPPSVILPPPVVVTQQPTSKPSTNPTTQPLNPTWKEFIVAIGEKETGNLSESKRYTYKEGDGGQSWGWLQIKMGVIYDVNAYYHTNYTSNDRLSKSKSEQICYLYINRWSKHFKDAYGREPTLEEKARIWNGGPNGATKESTRQYGKDVIKIMQVNKE